MIAITIITPITHATIIFVFFEPNAECNAVVEFVSLFIISLTILLLCVASFLFDVVLSKSAVTPTISDAIALKSFVALKLVIVLITDLAPISDVA